MDLPWNEIDIKAILRFQEDLRLIGKCILIFPIFQLLPTRKIKMYNSQIIRKNMK